MFVFKVIPVEEFKHICDIKPDYFILRNNEVYRVTEMAGVDYLVAVNLRTQQVCRILQRRTVGFRAGVDFYKEDCVQLARVQYLE